MMNAPDIKAEPASKDLAARTATPARFAPVVESDPARWQKCVVDARTTAD